MNEAASATERDDGYIQDLGSQWVADAVGAQPGERVLDLCAAPGRQGHPPGRHRRDRRGRRPPPVAGRAHRRQRRHPRARRRRRPTGAGDRPAASCCRSPPTASTRRSRRRRSTGCWSTRRARASAPCAAARRPLAHRGRPTSTPSPTLQLALVEAALALVRPGGHLVYSVCTLTAAETTAIDAALAERHPDLVAVDAARRPVDPRRPRRAPAPAGRRHRRHVPAPPHRADRVHRRSHASPTVALRRDGGADAAAGRVRRMSDELPGSGLLAKVLTASDGVVAGTREDRSGAALVGPARGRGVHGRRAAGGGRRAPHGGRGAGRHGRGVRRASSSPPAAPASGPATSPPRARSIILDRQAPGLAEAMRLVNPLGRLSRGVAGNRGEALILNTPGSTGGADRVPRGGARRRAPRPAPAARRSRALTDRPDPGRDRSAPARADRCHTVGVWRSAAASG